MISIIIILRLKPVHVTSEITLNTLSKIYSQIIQSVPADRASNFRDTF